jgi:hypothetical protein
MMLNSRTLADVATRSGARRIDTSLIHRAGGLGAEATGRVINHVSAERVAPAEEWDLAALQHAVRRGGSATRDDVSITMDGRRLDAREAVLTFLAEVETVRAGRDSHDRV